MYQGGYNVKTKEKMEATYQGEKPGLDLTLTVQPCQCLQYPELFGVKPA